MMIRTYSLRTLTCLAVLPFLFTACDDRSMLGINSKEIFDALPGPKVDGVEATLLKNAKRVEASGDYNQALQLYKQLYDMDEENEEYILALGTNLRRIGDVSTAELAYNELLEKDADNLDALEGKGLLKLYQGEFDKAGELLAQVHGKNQSRWRTLNGLAIIFVERGQYKEATAYFKEAIKFSQNNVTVLNNVGLTHAINGDQPRAVAALTQAIELSPPASPTKKNIELNLAMVLGIYGDMEAAEEILMAHLPEASVANNLGLYAYLAKDEVLAKSYLNTALSKTPYHYKRAWENLLTITENSDGDVRKHYKGRGKVLRVPQGKKTSFIKKKPMPVVPEVIEPVEKLKIIEDVQEVAKDSKASLEDDKDKTSLLEALKKNADEKVADLEAGNTEKTDTLTSEPDTPKEVLEEKGEGEVESKVSAEVIEEKEVEAVEDIAEEPKADAKKGLLGSLKATLQKVTLGGDRKAINEKEAAE